MVNFNVYIPLESLYKGSRNKGNNMAHTKNNYQFDSKEDAQKFADAEKVSYDPSCDVYVTGPMFMDEAEIFKNIAPEKTDTYWLVGVEVYK